MLHISHLNLSLDGQPAIRDGSLALARGEKAGLVGPNGSGKSTLLAAIAAQASGGPLPDYATVSWSFRLEPGAELRYVPQEWRDPPDVGVAAFLGPGRHLVPDWVAKSRLSELSGGWRKFVALAKAFAENPDIILLDEPTNDLDAEHVGLFVGLLERTSASVLMVSHDRQVLDRCVSTIYELDPLDKSLKRFGGGYSAYRQAKDVILDSRERAFEDQRKKRERIQTSISRLSDHAHGIEAETTHFFYRARAAKLERRAVHQKKRLATELERLLRPQTVKPTRFLVEDGKLAGSAAVLVAAKNVGFGYGDVPILRDVSFSLRSGSRFQVSGPNGSGKSTLLKLAAGLLAQSDGGLETAGRVGYLPQTVVVERPSEPVARFLGRSLGLSAADIGQAVGGILKRNPETTQVGELSEGELKKLHLACLLAGGYDALALDEPTNHLDLDAVYAVERALAEYHGAVIVVSHDARFLDAIEAEMGVVLS